MTRHLYYHYDLDGYTAGAIAFKEGDVLHEVDYDHYKSPLDEINPGDEAVIVDYSFKPKEMLWIRRYCDVTWIDHHVSAVKDSEKYGYGDLKGLREIGRSGAELSWTWFMKTEVPVYAELVGEYDTFRSFDGKPEYFRNTVVPFYYGAEMNMESLKPGLFTPGQMTDKKADEFIELGNVVRQYKIETGRRLYREVSYVKELWGYRCLCVNTPEQGSLFLTMTGLFDPEKHDLMFTYSFNGDKWCYGWYTDGHPEVNCAEIAKQYGGGGHQGAAGACSRQLIEGVL